MRDLLSILIDDALESGDPTTVVSLYTAAMDLDPFSDEAMLAANPAAGDFLNIRELRRQAENARRMPSQEALYRNYTLNQRVDAIVAVRLAIGLAVMRRAGGARLRRPAGVRRARPVERS